MRPLLHPTWLFWTQLFPHIQWGARLTGGPLGHAPKGMLPNCPHSTPLRMYQSIGGRHTLPAEASQPVKESDFRGFLMACICGTHPLQSSAETYYGHPLAKLQYNGGTRPRVSKHWGIWLATRVRGWWLWGGCQGLGWGFSWKTHV